MRSQSCPTLCDPTDCSLPGSSVHEILQARILEWVAISFSRGSSQHRDRPHCLLYWQVDSLPLRYPGSPAEDHHKWDFRLNQKTGWVTVTEGIQHQCWPDRCLRRAEKHWLLTTIMPFCTHKQHLYRVCDYSLFTDGETKTQKCFLRVTHRQWWSQDLNSDCVGPRKLFSFWTTLPHNEILWLLAACFCLGLVLYRRQGRKKVKTSHTLPKTRKINQSPYLKQY